MATTDGSGAHQGQMVLECRGGLGIGSTRWDIMRERHRYSRRGAERIGEACCVAMLDMYKYTVCVAYVAES